MTARDIAMTLGVRTQRLADGSYMVPCPVLSHGKGRGDRSPSLRIGDGDTALLVHCFAGCDPRDVLAVLRRRGLLDDAHWHPYRHRHHGHNHHYQFDGDARHDPDSAALNIWAHTTSGAGSLIETYLRSRSITIPVPPSLRYSTAPAMIAAVQAPGGRIIAVQTTKLTNIGRKAPVEIPRVTRGALGAGAVRLGKASDVVGIAEGVETALAAMQLTEIPCWACIGAKRMHLVALPDSVRELHIFADNDKSGEEAAERTANLQRHRRVVLRYTPNDYKDWNDLLIAVRATA